MSRPPTAAALLFLAMLTGCGQAPSDRSADQANAAATARQKIRNSYQEKLLALNDLNRDLTLRRAVRDDGGSCPQIRGNKYQQDYKGMAMWVAHCTSGDWAVFIDPSGSIQARRCEHAEQLKLPACHPWPAEATGPVAAPRWPEPPAPPATLNSL